MKQYTNESQTAKLIELGFEKPKNALPIREENKALVYQLRYTIGELIELLPKSLKNPYNPPLAIEYNGLWRVYYGTQEFYTWEWSIWYEEERTELIDALYDMAVKLKEKGVI